MALRDSYFVAARNAEIYARPGRRNRRLVDLVESPVVSLLYVLLVFVKRHSALPHMGIVPHGYEQEYESRSAAGNCGL